jgi:RNA polymerase sigma-70 factor (ECF subfamily)
MDYNVLLKRFADDGDHEAFQALYDRFHTELHGFVFKSCPVSPPEINDILQDVWALVVCKAHLYDPEQSARNWLYRITERVSLNAQRARHAQKRSGCNCDTFSMNDVAVQHYEEDRRASHIVDDPLQTLLDEEQRQRIQEVIDQLPESERKAVNAVYLEGMTLEEAAAVLETLENTIGVQLSRARPRLKRMLADLVQY